MKPSVNCINLVKQSESLAKLGLGGMVEAYPDPAYGWKVPTIGWGTTSGVKRDSVWTIKQCEDALAADLDRFGSGVTKLLGGARTTQNQFDALVDFAYNLGLGNLDSSTLLKKHKAGDFDGASREFSRWNKANGVVLKGLTVRRQREADLYSKA